MVIITIIIFAGIMIPMNFSIEKDDESYILFCNHWIFSDHKECKTLWDDQKTSEQTQMIDMGIVAIPSSREFLRMDCEDLYMYKEPPNLDVADAWKTRLHECQNGQEQLPVLIELKRWRQVNCMDIINNTMPEFENVISQQAFDIRLNQCKEIMGL